MTLKSELEAIWCKPGLRYSGNRTVWTPGYEGSPQDSPGEACATHGGAGERRQKRLLAHPGFPASIGGSKPRCPDWLRERYKRNCPRNYKQLIAEYGMGVTQGDKKCNDYYKTYFEQRDGA